MPPNSYVGIDEMVLLDENTHEPICAPSFSQKADTINNQQTINMPYLNEVIRQNEDYINYNSETISYDMPPITEQQAYYSNIILTTTIFPLKKRR